MAEITFTERECRTLQAALQFWKSHLHSFESMPYLRVIAGANGIRPLNEDEIEALRDRITGEPPADNCEVVDAV